MAPLTLCLVAGNILFQRMHCAGQAQPVFDNSVPTGHNSSLSFRLNKIPVVFAGSVRKKMVRGGDFAIELS